MGNLETHGGFCNICGVMLEEDHTHFSRSQMKKAVFLGLRPPMECPSWTISRAMGASRTDFDAEWATRISDSTACPRCAENVKAYLLRKTGMSQERFAAILVGSLVLILITVIVYAYFNERKYEWPTTSFRSGPVYSFARDPQGKTVYAITSNGLFRSQNDGSDWKQIFEYKGKLNFTISTNGSLHIGPLSNYIQNSHDYGDTWSKGLQFEGEPNVDAFAIDSHGAMFFAVHPENLRDIEILSGPNDVDRLILTKVFEEPLSIGKSESEIPDYLIRKFVFGADDSYYAFSLKNLLRSVDRGNRWERVRMPSPELKFYDLAFTPGNHLHACTSEGIYCSIDHATTWSKISSKKNAVHATVSNGSSGMYAALEDSGIWYSSNHGKTWERVGVTGGFGSRDPVLSLVVTKNSRVLAGGEKSGIYYKP